MTSHGSVTRCIAELRRGESEAARQLWQRYSQRLVEVAAESLGKGPRVAADQDDLAASAFASLCRRARTGQFPALERRHDLWRLLVRITERKAITYLRREARLKRGGGRVVSETDLVAGGSVGAGGLNAFPAAEPSPEIVAAMTDSVRALLSLLDDEERQIALWKLEGFTNAEIANRIGRAVPTIERRLRLIRAHWHAWSQRDESDACG